MKNVLISLSGNCSTNHNLIDLDFEDILKSLKRKALHAHTLGFVHPKTNQDVFYASDLPEDLNRLKNRLETLKN